MLQKGVTMDLLFPLFHFIILVLLGLLFALIADRIRMQYEFPLLLLGLVLGTLVYAGRPLIEAPLFVIIVMAASAMILVSFDTFSKLRWREWDSLSHQSVRLAAVHFILSFSVTFMFAHFIMGSGLALSLILAGTVTAVSVGRYSHRSHRVTSMLRLESLLSSAASIVIVTAVIGALSQRDTIFGMLSGGLIRVVTGCAVGVFLAIIVLALYRNRFLQKISPILLVVSMLATYIAAELLRGDGIVATALMGLFFGNFTVQKKRVLEEHTSRLANSLMILVCIIFGVHVHMSSGGWQPLWQALGLFLVLLLVRMVSVMIASAGTSTPRNEYAALILHAPRGSVAIALLFLVLGSLHGSDAVIVTGALVILFSQILEFFMSRTRAGSV